MENTRSGLNGVTPCVGVWIETVSGSIGYNLRYVTPCVGVWIETAAMAGSKSPASSHPAWVCGLKRLKKKMVLLNLKSHPAWVCGLKLVWVARTVHGFPSHPAWVCGLKPRRCVLNVCWCGHTLRGCVD